MIGPLTINKTHYLIGENIFMSMNLNPMEVGYVSLYSHENKLMYKFKFNGSKDPNTSQYFRFVLHIQRCQTFWNSTIRADNKYQERL